MIFKMVAVRHFAFSKFDTFVIELSFACDYASELQVSY